MTAEDRALMDERTGAERVGGGAHCSPLSGQHTRETSIGAGYSQVERKTSDERPPTTRLIAWRGLEMFHQYRKLMDSASQTC